MTSSASLGDPFKAVADFWMSQGQAMLKAQQQAGQAITDTMKVLTGGVGDGPADFGGSSAELSGASEAVSALMAAASALSASLVKGLPGASVGGEETTVEATFRKMVDPQSWLAGMGEADEAFGRIAEAPRLADLWDVERRFARVLQAWVTLRRAGMQHNAVMLEAWLKAGQQFQGELAGRIVSTGDAPDSKAAIALWVETANRQLLETQHAQPFLETQAAVIRATTDLKMSQQDLVEHYGKQYGFPTRTEMDDVHRTVTELRREIRALRREQRLAASQAQVAVAAIAPVVERPAVVPPTRRVAPRKRGAR